MEKHEPIGARSVAADMTPEQLMSILNDASSKFAFLLGNGINRYAYRRDLSIDVSWENLLREAAARLGVVSQLPSLKPMDDSISLTEYYSLLLMASGNDEYNLQQHIADIVDSWEFTEEHGTIRQALQNYGRPVLTTNVDCLLDKNLTMFGHERDIQDSNEDEFVFPAHTFWGLSPRPEADSEFSMWHINGFVQKPASLRFGLIDYAKLIKRVFCLIDEANGIGIKDTWIDYLFNLPLCIIGLGLEKEEIFLRSLLLRKRHRQQNLETLGWYCYTRDDEMTHGKAMMLKEMEISPVMFSSYEEMYRTIFPEI